MATTSLKHKAAVGGSGSASTRASAAKPPARLGVVSTTSSGSTGRPAASQRLAPAGAAILLHDHAGAAAEKGDPAMAQAEQMLGGAPGAAEIVRRHAADPAGRAAAA